MLSMLTIRGHFCIHRRLLQVAWQAIVFDHHDLSPEMYQARFPGGGSLFVHGALVLLEKLTCCLADRVIATNESYKKIEMERDHVPETRITVVRNGVELHDLREIEPDRAMHPRGKLLLPTWA